MAEALSSLPYSFAKRHGVLLQINDDNTQVLCRAGVTPLAIAEVQRAIAGDLQFVKQ